MRGLFDLGGKNVLRLGLLVFSTLLIVGGSVFFYDRLVYERALSVGGVITGSGSTTQTGLNPAPGTILILSVSAVLISLSVFGFLREMFRGRSNRKALARESSPTAAVSLPLEIGPPLQVPSIKRDWEEAPKKDESKH
ncbi:MAG TPA: hypothetical protein VNW25_03085 [Candidatus Sulfotelmatobacter sp.]|jgi:hypothetical protein|nr:hypothetical protein [Candidatus Sulfotelmatobacter sp.]